MKKILIIALSIVLMITGAFAWAQKKENSKGQNNDVVNIVISTSMGDIYAELYKSKAPITVTNFVNYINDKYFDGLIFHRVIPNFMIQGGGMTADMSDKATRNPIAIESNNGLKNLRGTLAMARTQDPNSATSQFFINHVDNPFLDYKAPTMQGYGYAVFGKVTKGMDVVDKIAMVKTTTKGFHENVPVTPVVIKSIRIVK